MATISKRVDDDGQIFVDCSSSHLTPFAVLVDVSGSLTVKIIETKLKYLHVQWNLSNPVTLGTVR